MNEQPGRPRSLPTPPPGDPLLAERLARLTARSAAARPAGNRPAGPGPTRAGAIPPAPPAPSSRTAAPTRRRHAAKGSRMAALALSLATTGGLTAMFARADGASAGSDAAATDVGASTAATQVAVVQPSATTAAPATTAAAAATTAAATAEAPATTAVAATTVAPETTATVAASGLADGTFVGAVDSNKWGNVQVQVTISGGVITGVDTLQYPDGDRKSVRINEQALPTLESQVLSAQSSSIDGVSGATYTANSYVDSLQSALDQALAA